MSDAHAVSVGIVAYMALFAGVGLFFIFIHLLLGRLVRPNNPHQEKLEIYECGEPTIGTSFAQFDLRFYVVALLFIIFDVEVAFFFPWATVFGKATHFADKNFKVVEKVDGKIALTEHAAKLQQEMGVRNPVAPSGVPDGLKGEVVSGDALDQADQVVRLSMRKFALFSVIDILVFFGVLMLGFLYVWRCGDLDWVRAYQRESAIARAGPLAPEPESAVSV